MSAVIRPLASAGVWSTHPMLHRALTAAVAACGGVVVAGFWNYKLVDGFGRGVVAANTIGNPDTLASSFASNGALFGVVFAAVAGLAATFTACNCVVFAMLPGLACATDRSSSRRVALKALGLFTMGVLAVGVLYGLYVGTLGAGVKAFNSHRLAQAEIVFTTLGSLMIAWSVLEFGFLRTITDHIPAGFRSRASSPTTRATIMGLMVGSFAVGRPYPLFRDLLVYAASSHNPIYGATVMAVQGLGQITLMVVIFLIVIWLFSARLTRWVNEKPNQPRANHCDRADGRRRLLRLLLGLVARLPRRLVGLQAGALQLACDLGHGAMILSGWKWRFERKQAADST